jgi:hypothetical protein
MSKDIPIVHVTFLPQCDFCGEKAMYDAATNLGPWANLCSNCFDIYGLGLGLGKGQHLVQLDN